MKGLGLDPGLVKRRKSGAFDDGDPGAEHTNKAVVFIACDGCGHDLIVPLDQRTTCTQCSRSYHFLTRR